MQRNEVVSSEDERLILVDEADNEIGFSSKAICHDGAGQLHRAFSVFLFDEEGRLLLQQRGQSKRLWPGFWSNSCCSHPREGETMDYATARRLKEELGIEVELEFIYRFSYTASFGEAGSENELCSVYLGRCLSMPQPNVTEIEAIRYLAAADVVSQLTEFPELYTPWFKQEWHSLITDHAASLAKYLK